jgi:WhiB family redox-sensing transcriptional regulator
MTFTINPARHRSLGDHTWHDSAACKPTEHNPVDPDLFFPEPDAMDKIDAAKRLCAQCPVAQICLDAALEHGDTHGIRGGLTEEERSPLHDNLPSRLDYSRVNATLAGRDIHLTKAEHRAVARAAYRNGISSQRLAWLLKISEGHAQKLYRQTRRALRNRNAQQAAGTGQALAPGAGRAMTRGDFGTVA